MSAKNSVKIYSEDSYYHIYNRGVEKRQIFLDEQDYAIFLFYLKEYLLPKDEHELRQKLSGPDTSYKEKDKILKLLRLNNFFEEITLNAYCLMTNHFHLLVKQRGPRSIDQFMRSLCTRYVTYFNRKYKRVGPLFQDVYKAVMVQSNEQLVYLTGYIHRNPVGSEVVSKPIPRETWFSQPSSYPEYLGQRKTAWITSSEILSFFPKINTKLSYQFFVEQESDVTPIIKLIIDP